MNCNESDTLMQRSLDDVLTKTERTDLDLHLQSCAACSRAFAEYRSLTRLVRGWSLSGPEPSANSQAFLASVMNAIEHTPARQPSIAVQCLGVGAFVVIVVLAIGYLTPAVQPVSSMVAVPLHPMGMVDSAISTLMTIPRDETQSIQSWISETQTGLPLNLAAWTAVAINGMLIIARILSRRRKAMAGGSHA